MAGILDYKRGPSFLPQAGVDGRMPQIPAQGGGMLSGWFEDDPDAIVGDGRSGRTPLTGQQKRGLLFSGLADAIDNLQGRDGTTTETLSKQYTDDYTKQKSEQRRAAVNKAIQSAYASGDMNQVRQALMAADPADVAHITSALSFGQPKYMDVGGGLAQLPGPMGGDPTMVMQPRPKAPLTNGGMQSSDNGATWTKIPGYVDQQRAIGDARRAPPKPASGGPLGNPASLFGAR